MPKCVECGGRKEVPCTRCRAPASGAVGRQRKSCECCKRKGSIECPACGGTGKAGHGRGLPADKCAPVLRSRLHEVRCRRRFNVICAHTIGAASRLPIIGINGLAGKDALDDDAFLNDKLSVHHDVKNPFGIFLGVEVAGTFAHLVRVEKYQVRV